MAAVMRGLLVTALAALLLDVAMGADFTVGSPNGGWDLNTDLAAWAQSQRFTVGDNLIFRYTPSHDVVEVNQAAFDSCSNSNPISTSTSGNDQLALTAPGTRYFICGIPGHCSGGMKVQIDVVAGSSGSPPTTPATPPAAPSTPRPSPATPAVPPPSIPSPPSTPSAPSPSGLTPPPPAASASQGSGLNSYFRSVLGAAIVMTVCALV